MEKANVSQDMNHDQVKNVLRFVDASQTESVKRSIFGELGRQCFCARKLDAWTSQWAGDVQGFLDRVNVEHASKYWERLEFSEDGAMLILTGRKVSGCACAFSDGSQAPKSLCHYCCKRFQEELFGTLLGRKVEVQITAAYLLGDERCNTVIRLV